MGLRARLQAATLGLYPGAIKWAMAVFDLPEAIAVARMQVGSMRCGLLWQPSAWSCVR
jgi:hypothetical protein